MQGRHSALGRRQGHVQQNSQQHVLLVAGMVTVLGNNIMLAVLFSPAIS